MDKHAWSLVTFTLLAQVGAGTFFLSGLLALIHPAVWGNDAGSLYRKLHLLVLMLLLTAVFLSFFHLGYPRHFFHALNNLGQSWLSREIFGILLLGAITLLSTLLSWGIVSMPGKNTLLVAGMVAALFLLLAMSRLYQLETVPAWQSLHTPLAFFLAALLTGTGLLLMAAAMLDFPAIWIRVLGLSGLVFTAGSLVNHLLWTGGGDLGINLPGWTILMSMAGVLFFLGLLLQPGWSGFRIYGLPMVPVLALVFSMTAEIVFRWQFFMAFQRLGV